MKLISPSRRGRRKKKEKINSSAHFLSWYTYCKAYLLAACIGLRELRAQKYRNGFTLFDQDYIYEEKVLLIPIIWSIKHAIELLLKEVDVRVTNKFLSKHDPRQLRTELENALLSLGAKRFEFADKLSAISEKYLRLKFWGGSITPINIVDEQNDIFRYPEGGVFYYPKSNVRFTFPIPRLRRASRDELQELEDDLEQLERLLKALYGQVTDLKIISERNHT